jgi:GH25 family lysozyme M1 (1,4-beta-N-acetylmuramidase)
VTEPHAKGFDASHWNADSTFDNALDWADFAAIKVTEGTGYTDPEFSGRWAMLKSSLDSGALVCRIAYAFLNGSNGTAEADHALAEVGTVGDHDLLAADFEAAAATGGELIACVKRWHDKLGRKQLVYGGFKLRTLSSADRASVAKYADLWLADWSAPYSTIDPWADWTFLQYVGTGLDLDEFDGARAVLATYLGTAPTPKPSPGDTGAGGTAWRSSTM